jgi:acetyltransferase-like isoleucine patch superfamily enzyme
MSIRLAYRRRLGALVRRLRRYVNDVAIIGEHDAYAASFYYFGRGAAIMAPQGVMYNERYLSIGDGALIGPNVTISAGMSEAQEMLHAPVVTIGRGCVVGRGTHIVGHWSIELGENIQIGPNVYITDQNHSYEDIDAPIGWQVPTEAPVKIGSGSWLGANAIILPGTTLGENTVVAAGAVVRGAFPPHVVIGGVPARVLKQHHPDHGWRTKENN